MPILAIYGTAGEYKISGHKPALRAAFEQVHLKLFGLLAREDNRGRRVGSRVRGVVGLHARQNSSMPVGSQIKRINIDFIQLFGLLFPTR